MYLHLKDPGSFRMGSGEACASASLVLSTIPAAALSQTVHCRAIDGDVVAIELLPEAKWHGASTCLPTPAESTASNQDVDDEDAIEEEGGHIAQVGMGQPSLCCHRLRSDETACHGCNSNSRGTVGVKVQQWKHCRCSQWGCGCIIGMQASCT